MNEKLETIIYIGTSGTLIIVIGFIFFVLNNQRKRLKKDLEIIELKELRQKEATLAAFRGQENERQRISKDLHDGIGASLASIVWDINTLRLRYPGNNKLHEELNEIKLSVINLIDEVRNISHDLMPYPLQYHDLTGAVEQIIEKANKIDDIRATFRYSGNPTEISQEEEKLIFRCVQELISNTIQHSAAKNISVNFQWLKDKLLIIVSDDGTGFDFNQEIKSISSGLGLKNIQNRLKILGAKLNFESSDSGSKFTVTIPLKTIEA